MRKPGAPGPGGGEQEEPGNAEPPPPFSPNIRVVGVERTQATQYFGFNGQGTGFAPDNSIRLLEGRNTVFRVYVDVRRADETFPVPGQVTGELTWYRHANDSLQSISVTMAPLNGPIPARSSSAIDRTATDSTLNFRVPAWLATNGSKGTVGIGVRVWDPAAPGMNSYSSRWYAEPPFSLLPAAPLPVHVVRLVYTGPDQAGVPTRIGPPSEQEMVNTLFGTFLTKVFPIPEVTLTGNTIEVFGGDLRTTGASGCGPGWTALLDLLRRLRTASNSASVYVGLLPRGTPMTASGCGGGGVAAGQVANPFAFDELFRQQTMAHEIAHAYGRMHAPCQTSAPNTDPGYPAYPGLPAGSIGETGFDALRGVAVDPLILDAQKSAVGTFDYMSYCTNQWTSPYTYRELMWAVQFPFFPPWLRPF